jgi:hypothetical protein
MNTDTPKTACADCGSTEESYFSRIEPMGYFCPDCGHEEGKPVERQCDNQSDKMTNITDTPETDEALSTAECESDLVMRMRRIERERDELKRWTSVNGVIDLQRERDEAREEIIGWRNKWQVAVEMAALAQNQLATVTAQRDEAREALAELRASLTPKQ